MKKKFLAILILAIGITVIISGCGKEEDTSGKSGEDQSLLEEIKERDKLIVGINQDMNLFGLKNTSTGDVEGFDADLMKLLAKDLLGDENKLEFKEVTSKTRVALLEKGDVDIVAAAMTITDERKKEMDFSEPYFIASHSLLVPIDSPIKTIEDIDQSDKTVVTAKGSNVWEVIEEFAPNANLQEYENFAEAFTALKSGKGDTLVTHNSILLGMIDQSKENGKETFRMTDDELTFEELGFSFRKENESFVEYVDDWLEKIETDGTYDEIYEKWFGDDEF